MKTKPHILKEEGVLLQSAESRLPTVFGDFKVSAFGFKNDNSHLYLEYGEDTSPHEPPVVRIHSECITSEVFGSLKCDCKDQLFDSIEKIQAEGYGIIIYLRQEGRGIGLFNKINAYRLQEEGFNTIEANHELNFETDLRDYYLAYLILKKKGIGTIRLITNSMDKITQLENYGLIIESLIHTKPKINVRNRDYIETKIKELGHNYIL